VRVPASSFARTSAGRKDIRESIGPGYSGLEEAKADVVLQGGEDFFRPDANPAEFFEQAKFEEHGR